MTISKATCKRTQQLPTLLAQQCWELRPFARSWHVWPVSNFAQQLRSQPHATRSSRVWKRMQHITFNNTGPKMFCPFARGLSCKFFLLYRYWWNTRTFPFTKKSYLHRAQWRYYFYLSRGRILVSPWLPIWLANYKRASRF